MNDRKTASFICITFMFLSMNLWPEIRRVNFNKSKRLNSFSWTFLNIGYVHVRLFWSKQSVIGRGSNSKNKQKKYTIISEVMVLE